MSRLEGQTLNYAVLREQAHTPDTGTLGPVLTAAQSGTGKGYKMVVEGDFVHVEAEHKVSKKPITLSFPLSSFRMLVANQPNLSSSKATVISKPVVKTQEPAAVAALANLGPTPNK